MLIHDKTITRLGIIRASRLLVALLLAWPATAMAVMPSGVLVFDFPVNNPIFDLGSLSDCDFVDGVTYCLDLNMVPDGKGKYSGTATLEFSGDITGTLIGPASGATKGKETGGFAKFKLKLSGGLNFQGSGFGLVRASESCSGNISAGGQFVGECKAKTKVTIAGRGASVSTTATFAQQLTGGVWTLTIANIQSLNSKSFIGTATDSLGYSYTVRGRYNDKKDTSKINAKGIKRSASHGAKVQLKDLTDTGEAEAKFKVQGYKGKRIPVIAQ